MTMEVYEDDLALTDVTLKELLKEKKQSIPKPPPGIKSVRSARHQKYILTYGSLQMPNLPNLISLPVLI